MPVTLTDQQAAQVRSLIEQGNRNKQSLDQIQQFWNDPKFGDRAKALWKEAYPETPIDGYDQKVEVQKVVEQFKDERKKEREEAELQQRTEKVVSQRKEVQEREKLTDDEMKRMEAMMTERDIYDYEAGALLFAAKNPRPTDASADYDNHYMQYDKRPEWKELATDPEKWGFETLVKAYREDQRGRNPNRY